MAIASDGLTKTADFTIAATRHPARDEIRAAKMNAPDERFRMSDLSAFPITKRWPAQHPDRIQLYSLPTPNGVKVSIMLEETGLPYEPHLVDFNTNDQHSPEFLSLNPNGKIPAIIDPNGPGGKPLGLFESGAILIYLAEKAGKFLPTDMRKRFDVLQWLMWQMGGLGPMAGQNHHFVQYAPERIPYAMERYVKETNRLYGVLNKRLADREFIAGEYSIADMACYPWIVPYKNQQQNLDDFPHLKRWFEAIYARPATARAYKLAKQVNPDKTPTVNEESKKILFGQVAGKN